LPIGYWDLPGNDFTIDTPFEQYNHVYEHAWFYIKALCAKADSRGIGVVLDFHGLPGGANPDDHSGTNSGKAELWVNNASLELSRRCFEFVSRETLGIDNVIAIEVINEAIYNAPGMYDWYDSVINLISSINPTMPVYISDGWDLSRAIEYSLRKNSVSTKGFCPILIDTHKYYCFSDANKFESPQHIIKCIPSELDALNSKEGDVASRGAVQVIIGEYSCTLAESSWTKKGKVERSALEKQFGNAQIQAWQKKAGGSFFWTYKMVRSALSTIPERY
jgi:aryl-phospho-beta-D-glucosidase BglC (GH1 family)